MCRLLVIVLLVLTLGFNVGDAEVNNNMTNNTVKNLRIGIYAKFTVKDEQGLRIPDGIWSTSMPVGACLAIEHFRERNGILAPVLASEFIRQCPLNLTYTVVDTQSTASIGVENFLKIGAGKIDVIIGATTSDLSVPLAIVTGVFNTPMISYGATAATLKDRSVFRLFGRTVPSDDAVANAIANYFKLRQYKRIGVLHVSDTYGSSYKEVLRSSCEALGITSTAFAFESGNRKSIQNSLRDLVRQRLNIIVAVTFSLDLGIIHEEGSLLDMFAPGKLWIFTDAVQASEITVNDLALRKALSGQMTVLATGMVELSNGRKNMKDLWPTFYNYSTKMNQYLPGGMNYREVPPPTVRMPSEPVAFQTTEEYFMDLEPDQHTPFAYDAVVTAILAACKMKEPLPIVDSDVLNPLYREIISTKFMGASGRVVFGEDGERISDNIILLNHQEIKGSPASEGVRTYTVGAWDGSEWTMQEDRIRYFNDSVVPPVDIDPPPHNQNLLGPVQHVFAYTLFGLAAGYCIVLVVWMGYNKDIPYIRYTQPVFLFLFLFGNFIVSFCILVFSFDPSVSDVADKACMSLPWLYSVGTVLKLSALIIKSYRIRVLFFNSDMRKLIITHGQLLAGVLLLLAIDITILVCWTMLDPLHWNVVVILIDTYDFPTESIGSCVSNSFLYPGLMIAYHFLLSVLASFVAYQIRAVPTQFQESRWIHLSTLFSLQLFIIAILAIVSVYNQPYARLYLFCLIFFAEVVVSASLIMLPKVRDKFNGKFGSSDFNNNSNGRREQGRQNQFRVHAPHIGGGHRRSGWGNSDSGSGSGSSGRKNENSPRKSKSGSGSGSRRGPSSGRRDDDNMEGEGMLDSTLNSSSSGPRNSSTELGQQLQSGVIMLGSYARSLEKISEEEAYEGEHGSAVSMASDGAGEGSEHVKQSKLPRSPLVAKAASSAATSTEPFPLQRSESVDSTRAVVDEKTLSESPDSERRHQKKARASQSSEEESKDATENNVHVNASPKTIHSQASEKDDEVKYLALV